MKTTLENSKRIKFLREAIERNERTILVYENCDGAGEYKKAAPYKNENYMLKDWLAELEPQPSDNCAVGNYDEIKKASEV